MVARHRCITLTMIDKDQKNAILAAEREFERRENLARALAVSGVTLIGKITSGLDPAADRGPPPQDQTDHKAQASDQS